MSEMTKHRGEVTLEEIKAMYPLFNVESYTSFIRHYPDIDVFLDQTTAQSYDLIGRISFTNYVYSSSRRGNIPKSTMCSDDLWNKFVSRSYKIVATKGELPYAHRS